MRARLLALAALVSSLVAGTVIFVNWNTGEVNGTIDSFGALELVDRSQCTMAACGAAQCTQANAILADAGSSCLTRLVECPFRIGPRIRAIGADAGVTFGPQKYQRVRLIALRCPAAGGGFSFGVPTDDNGWPIYAVTPGVTPACVRAPVAGGVTCTRAELDGGQRYFGAGNVFPAAEARGTGCQPVECTVMAGDDPDVDL